MDACFCGKDHSGRVYLEHKCLECTHEKERALWNWLQENTNIQFTHNYRADCFRTLDERYLLYHFLGETIIIDLEHLGCSHKPHANLPCALFYNEEEKYHCIHSENRDKYRRAIFSGTIRYIIKFPGELCNEDHFYKIGEALQMIENHKYTDGFSPLIIFIKNGLNDDRYRYLSDLETLFERRDIQFQTIE